MKRFLLIFILTFSFQTLTKSDDIRDFQIEGISIGDSLLDYYSEDEIKDFTVYDLYNYKKDKTFIAVTFYPPKYQFDKYEALSFEYKRDDKNYIIYGITGKIITKYNKDIKSCHVKQDLVFKEISQLFKNQKMYPVRTKQHNADKTGRSKVRQSAFEFSNGDVVIIACYNWHKETGYSSNFKINLFKDELNKWLNTND
jgi:hypothetical protein